MTRLLLPLVALLASTAIAAAAPEKMTDSQLDSVVAGNNPAGLDCGASAFDCGNNGWGNGWDPTNPGSDAGATAPSKDNNGTILGYGSINIDPVSSNNTALLGR